MVDMDAIRSDERAREIRRREWQAQQTRALQALSDSSRGFLLSYLMASISWTEDAWEDWESALQVVQTLEL